MTKNMTAGNRLGFRVEPHNKRLIEEAADILGLTVSAFANSVLMERAREVTERQRTTVLENRDRDVFLAMLERPPQPSANLVSLMAGRED